MNKAKSIFITFHVTLINLALLQITTLSWLQPLTSGWLGVFLIALPNLYFFVWLYMGRAARTSRNLHLLNAINLLGYSIVLTDPSMNSDPQPIIWGTLLLASSLAYVFWYSSFGDRSNDALAVGQKLPPFDLKSPEGQVVKSTHFKGKPYLLIFYRGNWCPLCMTQIREVAADYIELDRFGVKVALISPQPEAQTRKLAAKFDVPMEFYVDEGAAVAKKLGIADEGALPAGLGLMGYDKDTVKPTVLMLNKHGKIIYSDLTSNYRIRPEPDQFLEVARQQLSNG